MCLEMCLFWAERSRKEEGRDVLSPCFLEMRGSTLCSDSSLNESLTKESQVFESQVNKSVEYANQSLLPANFRFSCPLK